MTQGIDEWPEHAKSGDNSAPSVTRSIWRYPATLTLLAIAAVIGARYFIKYFAIEFGLLATQKSLLDMLAMPGVIPGLAGGMLTGSIIGEWIGFAIGMAAVYGTVGLALEWLLRALTRGTSK